MYNLQYALVAFAYFVFIVRKLRITYTICTLCFGCNSALISLLYKRLIRNTYYYYYYYYYMYNECYEHVPTNYVIHQQNIEKNRIMFQTHTHKKIGLLAIIYSFFLSFWSVYVKYVSDAKVKKNSARSLRSLDIIYGVFTSFLFSSLYNEQDHITSVTNTRI